jgi:hypothetical protein
MEEGVKPIVGDIVRLLKRDRSGLWNIGEWLVVAVRPHHYWDLAVTLHCGKDELIVTVSDPPLPIDPIFDVIGSDNRQMSLFGS